MGSSDHTGTLAAEWALRILCGLKQETQKLHFDRTTCVSFGN